MYKDLDEIKEMFQKADVIIQKNPRYLTMSPDDIFFEMKETEYEHIRWGIMVRAKMHELHDYSFESIISFLSGIKDNNLLNEYIGYVLQQEKHIDLIELLIFAFHQGTIDSIIYTIISFIKFEKNSHIDDLATIERIIEDLSISYKFRLFEAIAIIIVNNNEEDILFDRMLACYTVECGTLVCETGKRIQNSKKEKYDNWRNTCLNHASTPVVKIGIQLLEWDISFTEVFNQNFPVFEDKWNDEQLWDVLIPVYIKYLLKEAQYNEIVEYKLLSMITSGNQQCRIVFAQYIYLGLKNIPMIKRITNSFLPCISEEDDIWSTIDYPLSKIYEDEPYKLFQMLAESFIANSQSVSDNYWDDKQSIVLFFSHHESDIIHDWWNYFHGNAMEFLFSISCLHEFISCSAIISFIRENHYSDSIIKDLLKGCSLFLTDERKTIQLLFESMELINDYETFLPFCLNYMYEIYPGTLVEYANKYTEDSCQKRKELAIKVIDHDNNICAKINNGLQVIDILPSVARQHTYREFKIQENNLINNKAREESVFLSLVTDKKIKYGRKFAMIQTANNKASLKVLPFSHHTVSKELPKKYIYEPLEYIRLKNEYLKSRSQNEINT